jgi:hypothetical protein
MPSINPIQDPEQERIDAQIALAEALRKQGMAGDGGARMVGNLFVKGNQWGNLAQALGGAVTGGIAQNANEELGAKRDAERQAWLGQMPSATETQHYDPVSNPGTGPLAEGMEVPKDPRVLERAMTAWGAKAPKGMEHVQNAAITQAMLSPGKEADRVLQQSLIASQKEADRTFKEAMVGRKGEEDRKTVEYKYGTPNVNAPQYDYKPNGDGTFTMLPRTASAGTPRDTGVTAPKSAAVVNAEIKRDAQIGKDDKSLDFYDRRLQTLDSAVDDVLNAPGLKAATGAIDARLPALVSMTPNDKSNAAAYIKNLKEKMQTIGLQELKAAGISPGSVTEREWSKFAAMIGNVDETLDTPKFVEQLNRLKAAIASDRERVKEDRSALKGSGGAKQRVNIASETEWQKLTPGTPYVMPDGSTGVR